MSKRVRDDNVLSAFQEKPFIHLIMATRPDGMTSSTIEDTKSASALFATCAALLILDNGKIGDLCKKAMEDLKKMLSKTQAARIDYCTKTKHLQHVLITAHNSNSGCNCAELIKDIVETDDDVHTHQEYHQYTTGLTKKFSERNFVCEGLKAQILKLIPSVHNFGERYAQRILKIKDLSENGFVAYEYWDEDEDSTKISCFCTTHFPDYPAYELSRSLLEYGLSEDALHSIPESITEARELLQSLL